MEKTKNKRKRCLEWPIFKNIDDKDILFYFVSLTNVERLNTFELQILPQDVAGKFRQSDKFRAIELSVPNVIATFQVIHRDNAFNVLDSRVYNIDLNSGSTWSTLVAGDEQPYRRTCGKST